MEWPFQEKMDNNNSFNNSVDVRFVLNCPASSSSNVGSEEADVIVMGGGCAPSLLTSFLSIMVEEQGGLEGGQEGGVLLSSPSKNQKNPSGCRTGTPSSTQCPFKIRQSTSTPARALHSTATASMDMIASRVLLPPDIITNEDIISTNTTNTPLLSTSDAEYSFYSSLTDQVKSRFKGFKYKCAIPVMNGALPGYKQCMTVGETNAKDIILKGDLWAIKVNRCEDISSAERTRTRGFDGKNAGVEELLRYYCLAKGCKCLVLIARIAGGILAYEQLDKESNLLHKHSGHDVIHYPSIIQIRRLFINTCPENLHNE